MKVFYRRQPIAVAHRYAWACSARTMKASYRQFITFRWEKSVAICVSVLCVSVLRHTQSAAATEWTKFSTCFRNETIDLNAGILLNHNTIADLPARYGSNKTAHFCNAFIWLSARGSGGEEATFWLSTKMERVNKNKFQCSIEWVQFWLQRPVNIHRNDF